MLRSNIINGRHAGPPVAAIDEDQVLLIAIIACLSSSSINEPPHRPVVQKIKAD
jgi:hypothetical protein